MRTDIHRPSTINPADYVYVGIGYMRVDGLFDALALKAHRERVEAHMASTGGTWSRHSHGGSCHICGASAIYTFIFHHVPSNTYIRTGEDCAEKMEMAAAYGEMNVFKSAIKAAREAATGKQRAQRILEEKGIGRAWQIRLDYLETAVPEPNIWSADGTEVVGQNPAAREYWDRWMHASKMCDIVNKVIKYGDISDRAADFVRSLVDRHDHAEELIAQRKAEKEAAAPCPTGRVEITGTVLKVAEHESMYGITLKMTVKSTDGWVAWGSVPAGMDPKRGDTVTFVATLTPKDDDPKFGFFKRPVAPKAPVLVSAVA